jgi:hypothetical protein
MTPLEELLAKHHIRLKDLAPGRRYTTCPRCSASRSKPHQTAEVLGVTIEADGSARWGCNHCGWTGPEKGDGGAVHKGNGAGGDPWPSYLYDDGRLRKVKKPPNGAAPKSFFWQHRAESGKWKKGTGGVNTSALLYRVDEVARAIAEGRVVAVAEGEKDVDSLWRLDIPATCNAHGASEPDKLPKWTPRHSEQLTGADIVVLNDNDPPGYTHAKAVCRLSIGIAKRVRRLDLKGAWPEIPEGGDVSDWLAAGHGAEELRALIDAAPDYAPERRRIARAERERARRSRGRGSDRGRLGDRATRRAVVARLRAGAQDGGQGTQYARFRPRPYGQGGARTNRPQRRRQARPSPRPPGARAVAGAGRRGAAARRHGETNPAFRGHGRPCRRRDRVMVRSRFSPRLFPDLAAAGHPVAGSSLRQDDAP